MAKIYKETELVKLITESKIDVQTYLKQSYSEMRLKEGIKAIDLIFHSRHQKLTHSFCISY